MLGTGTSTRRSLAFLHFAGFLTTLTVPFFFFFFTQK